MKAKALRLIVHKGVILCALCVESATATPDEASADWRPLPIWGGGYMMDVKIAPSASNVWYALVDVGGPYRSDDAGATWRPLHRQSRLLDCGPYASMARGISVDPRDADSFVTAVGDVPELGGGLLVSRDGGETFRKTGSACFRSNGPRRMHGSVIDRNPFNPDELVAGECLDGLHVSTDNGETWTDCGPQGFWFSDVRFDLMRSEVVYACAPEHQGRGGFFRSLDGGREWMRLLDESPTEVRQIPGRGELLGLFHDRVRLSTDCGETWRDYSDGLILENLVTDGDPNPSKSTGVYIASGAGSSFWLVGNRRGDIFIRRPGEDAWTKTERHSQRPGDPPAEHSIAWSCKCRKMDALCSIVVIPGDDTHWLACDWHVIWESTDAGLNWTTRVKGITPLCPFAVSGSPARENVVLYGVADMGMYVSTDGGRSFHPERATSGANSFAFSALHPETGYAVGGKFTVDLIRTDDGGETWRKLGGLAGLPPLKPKEHGAYSVAVDPLNDDVWLAVSGPCRTGGGGTWRSRDGGASWEWLGSGLPEGKDLFKSYEFDKGNADSQLVFSPDGSFLACSHKTGDIARFDRETQTWKPAGHLPEGSRIFADPHVPGRFVRVGGEAEESIDGGRTFHPYRTIPAKCWYLAFDPRRPGSVVAGGSDGLFMSRDGGATFKSLPCGLDVPANGSRVMALDRGRLWLLTFGAGVWTRELCASAQFPELEPVPHIDARYAPRCGGIFGDYWWASRFAEHAFERRLNMGRAVDLVIIGDSIVHYWEEKHPDSWTSFTDGRVVVNLGYAGDKTQNAIWRIEHGELDDYKAENIAIMIGTNNNTWEKSNPTNVAAGVQRIVELVRERQPNAKLILHPIFPRGASADSKQHADPRMRNEETNKLLKQFAAKNPDVAWIDFNDRLVDGTDWVPREIMEDEIHPTDKGYAIWREAL